MNKLSTIILSVFFLLIFDFNLDAQTTGPESGTLLIIGGHAQDSFFLPLFKELAGGDQAEIVIIPTARDDESISQDTNFEQLINRFEKYNFKKITVLHTRSTIEANTPEFVNPLKTATGVWFQGGRQWRLADSYLNTLTHLEIFAVLHRKGVVAGTSAGATIQGSYLARGDTKANTIMMGDHEEGLSLIKNIAIDQHLLARNRHFDMFEIINFRKELLGIGLDENTGILVRGNSFEVIGEHYVAVYDRKRWSEERDTIINLKNNQKEFYFLKSGDRYDMLNRKILK
ncbi:MAG: peptidase S51 [Marinilabiliales bacterium]|nr:MAG: peptidase S51 [Marinilabiliales bacterium]